MYLFFLYTFFLRGIIYLHFCMYMYVYMCMLEIKCQNYLKHTLVEAKLLNP